MPVDVIPILDSTDVATDLDRALEVLNRGGLVVLPTETVYGVAGRIDLPESRKRLQALRASNEQAPWTLHLGDPEDVWKYVPKTSEFAARLVRKLMPGPVGLSFSVPEGHRNAVSETLGLESRELFDGDTITLRCPDHPIFEHIVSQLDGPVALTKLADVNGQLPADFGEGGVDVDLAVDAGPTRFSKPSTLLRVFDDHYEIVRSGVFDERIIERKLKTLVLFVCSGNTCRSPMAEALTRKIIAESLGVPESQLDAKGFNVASAGVFALPGTRATPQAVTAVGGMGADLSRHRSQPLTPELIHQADAIYTMGRSHAQAVQSLSLAAAQKLHPLDPTGDIEDPIGSDVSTYRNLAEQMQKLIRDRLKEDRIVG